MLYSRNFCQNSTKFKILEEVQIVGLWRQGAHVIVYIQVGRGGAQAKRYKSPCASTVISEYQNYSLANTARTRWWTNLIQWLQVPATPEWAWLSLSHTFLVAFDRPPEIYNVTFQSLGDWSIFKEMINMQISYQYANISSICKYLFNVQITDEWAI